MTWAVLLTLFGTFGILYCLISQKVAFWVEEDDDIDAARILGLSYSIVILVLGFTMGAYIVSGFGKIAARAAGHDHRICLTNEMEVAKK